MKLLLNLNEVIQATSISSATIYRRMAAGKFPRPVAVSDRAKRWRVADIAAWANDPEGWSPATHTVCPTPANVQ